MAAQYDAIAEPYRRSKASPVRRAIELPSFAALAGDVRGLAVLDLACGEGFYARWLKRHGAAAVTGVDVSPAMIELAEASERAAPLGIRYVCADAAELPELGCFGLVTAAYLLHYAPDTDALFAMARHAARCLPPGGRFVTLTENPAQPDEPAGGYAAYGFTKRAARPVVDGAPIRYAMVAGRECFEFEVRYFARATYEAALTAAGFREIRWHSLRCELPADAGYAPDYFDAYLAAPPIAALECRR